ncbi:MAG: hypothetical protein MRT15_05210 [archaeon YNP-LCB-003-016]|uniref:hypothetical protein n=1 Tax=Candidatus Culexarchaeum yellowstonense TaxID=2928963 RepID=UPI0026EC67F2|nr:hypothetical protein [Candidatus Culexarchaeum yellowstonense]MCR6691764.1 hypothetical protein [Candidatus Culexarchaeum yellowstonense]
MNLVKGREEGPNFRRFESAYCFALLLAEEDVWQFTNTYRDIITLTPYRPLLDNLNVVLKAR